MRLGCEAALVRKWHCSLYSHSVAQCIWGLRAVVGELSDGDCEMNAKSDAHVFGGVRSEFRFR